IKIAGGGANDMITVMNCRSESKNFLWSVSSTYVDMQNNFVNPNGITLWAATTSYALNACVRSTTTGKSDGRGWICTTAGISGGTEPTWTGSSVSENTVVWQP